MRTRILTMLLVGLLSVPAPALAQSAGDDQYRDPLAPSQTPRGGGGGSGGGGGGGGGSSQAPGVQESQSSGAQTTPAQSRDQLPATGFPTGALALVGAALLGAGAALRRAAGWAGP